MSPTRPHPLVLRRPLSFYIYTHIWYSLEATTSFHILIQKKLSSLELRSVLQYHTTWGFSIFLKEAKAFQQFPRAILQYTSERAKRSGLWFRLLTWINHGFKSCLVRLKKNSVTIIQWEVLLFIAKMISSLTSSLVWMIYERHSNTVDQTLEITNTHVHFFSFSSFFFCFL